MEEKKRRPRVTKADSDNPLQERADTNDQQDSSSQPSNDTTADGGDGYERRPYPPQDRYNDGGGQERRPYPPQDRYNDQQGGGGYNRPYQDRQQGGGGGYNRPYQDRQQGGGGGYNRPYQDRDQQGGGGGYNRPYQDRQQGGGGGYNRPYQDRDQQGGGGYNRPYQDRQQGGGGGGYNRPYQDRQQGGGGGGYNRPYQDRDQQGGGGGGYNRPYQDRQQGGGGGYNRPYQDRDQQGGGGGYNRPYQDRQQGGGGGYNRPYQDRDQQGGGGGYNRPYQDRQQGGGGYGGGGYGGGGYGGGRPQQRGGFNARPQRPKKNRQDFYVEKMPKPDLPTGEGMPLNKFLAHCGIASRRKAVEFIEQGLVKVNGTVVKEPYYRYQPGDQVICDGNEVSIQERMIYVLLNKPKGVITTTDDEHGRFTVMDIVDPHFPERIYPVGRLDRDTTGLILLTNDGDLAQKLTHPSHHVQKQYRIGLNRGLTKSDCDLIMAGMDLEDGVVNVNWIRFAEDHPQQDVVELEITMGRNRIVRRLFESLGYQVKRLDRFYFAGLTKRELQRGAFRELTQREVVMLKHFTGQPVPPNSNFDAASGDDEDAGDDDIETGSED